MKVSHLVEYSFYQEFEVPKRFQFFYTKDREKWSGNEVKLANEWIDLLYDKIPYDLGDVQGNVDCSINYNETW